LTQEAPAATEKKPNPIVPFMKLPDGYPDEPAYLWGVVCKNCNAKYLGSRTACGNCGSTGPFEETRFSDEGEIYSFAVVHRPQHPSFFKDVPIILVAIRLDEGPTMISSMVGCSPEDVRIGMRVAVTTYPSTDIVIPRFVPYSGRATVGVPRAVTSGQEEPSST